MPGFFEKHGDTVITVATVILAFAALVAIVDQRFNAQDRRIDDLKAGMNQRFDAQGQRIEDLKAGMNRRFDAQGQRIDRLTDEVFELRRLVAGIGERVSRSEGQIEVIREQIRIADEPSP